MITELINLMKLVDLKSKQILKTGKRLQERLADGSILIMIIKQWTLGSWKVFGGYSKSFMIKV